MKISVSLLKQILLRNRYCRYGKLAKKKRVNLEYFDCQVNLGDVLSPVICQWMLDRASLTFDQKTDKTYHLMAIGSILGGSGFFDATVWGSGIKSFDQIATLSRRKFFQKLDLRSVRGPLTRQALIACGYKCPERYGDPAVLLPLIYNPRVEKTCKIGTILHFKHDMKIPKEIKNINIKTSDYEDFVNQMCSCEKIISSSLHGIILAEAYNIPAVFLGDGRDYEMFKYFDWYLSTGRKNVKIAYSLDEAIQMQPLDLPDLSLIQASIMETFPYDLWK